jgi:hypothetical protein
MRQLGFDTYAIDQIECPDGLLWFLECEVRLHRTPIALDARSVDANTAMERVSDLATGGSGSFIVGRTMNAVHRSAYGRRLPTNSTRDVTQTKNFGGATVDEGQKREYEQRIADARLNIQGFAEQQNDLSSEEREINEEQREYKAKYVISYVSSCAQGSSSQRAA